MAKLLEYTLSLNDKISGKLQKIGATSQSAEKVFSKLQAQSKAADKVMNEMGRSVGSLQQKLALLKAERDWIPDTAIKSIRKYNSEIKKVERELNRLQTINGSKVKSWAKDAVNQMPGAGLMMNPLVAAGAGLAAITKLGIENEKAAVSYEVLLGSAEKAKKMLGEMNQFAAATPYSKGDLQESGKLMLSFGIAQEKIMPTMKMLGDIAMGDKEKLNSLTLAFSQVQSAGKLQGQDLLQLINAGFNPLQEISKKTGKSMGELKEAMSKGAISAQMVEEAFKSATGPGGTFYGMTEKIGNTIGGKLSTAMDKLKDVALKAFELIGPILSPALDALIGLFEILAVPIGWVTNGFKWLVDVVKEYYPWLITLGAAVAAYTIYVNALTIKLMALAAWKRIVAAATAVWEGVQWALNTAMSANPIGLIIAGIVALIAAIAYVIYKTEGWGSLWEGTVGFMKHSFYAFVEGVKAMWITFTNGFMIGINKIKEGWYSFKEAVGLGESSENQAALEKIRQDTEERKKAIVEAHKKSVEHMVKAKKALQSIDMQWNSEKSLSDVKDGLMKKLGIGGNSQIAGGTTLSGSGTGTNNPVKDGINSVVGGGKKQTNITVQLGKMLENIIINSGNLDEGLSEVESKVEEVFLRILNGANSLANG
jgi:tape measure domain-containing protein